MRLEVLDSVLCVVKNRRSQRSIRLSISEHFHEMIEGASPTRGNDRNRDRGRHGSGQLAVEPPFGAVTID